MSVLPSNSSTDINRLTPSACVRQLQDDIAEMLFQTKYHAVAAYGSTRRTERLDPVHLVFSRTESTEGRVIPNQS